MNATAACANNHVRIIKWIWGRLPVCLWAAERIWCWGPPRWWLVSFWRRKVWIWGWWCCQSHRGSAVEKNTRVCLRPPASISCYLKAQRGVDQLRAVYKVITGEMSHCHSSSKGPPQLPNSYRKTARQLMLAAANAGKLAETKQAWVNFTEFHLKYTHANDVGQHFSVSLRDGEIVRVCAQLRQSQTAAMTSTAVNLREANDRFRLYIFKIKASFNKLVCRLHKLRFTNDIYN